MGASSFFLFIPSGGEFILVVLAILLLFGADKIPDFAKLVGKGMKEFRKATEDIKREINAETKDIREDIKKGERAIRSEIDNIKNDVENIDKEEDPYAYGDEMPEDYYDSTVESKNSKTEAEDAETTSLSEDGSISKKKKEEGKEPDAQ